jgi:YD repeat-containing protein
MTLLCCQFGRQGTVTDVLTHTTTSIYDELGRVTKSVFADGSSISQAYDALGRKTSSTDELGRITTYEYDVIGDLTAVNQPQTSYVNGVTTYQYSPRYEYVYNNLGELALQRDAMDDNLVVVGQGGLNRETQYGYDAFGRRQERALPGQTLGTAATELDTFDKYGRVVTHRDFKGQTTKYIYYPSTNTDASANQLQEKRFYAVGQDPNNGSLMPMKVVYAYDTLGRQSMITEFAVGWTIDRTTTFTYDGDGHQLSKLVYGPGKVPGQGVSPDELLYYEYYPATGRLKRTYTGNSASPTTETLYGYDELGRLKSVTLSRVNGAAAATVGTTNRYGESGSYSATTLPNTVYSYDSAGNPSSVALPDGIQSSYTYDARNRLDLETITQSGVNLRQYDYHVLANGQRDYVLETSGSGGSATTSRTDWTYDTLGRLVAEKLDGNNNNSQDGSDYIANYSYDLVGNRTKKDFISANSSLSQTIT